MKNINNAHAAVSVDDLLVRPATGGKATIVLGGDNAEWGTTSSVHVQMELPSNAEAVARQSPGGTDSVDFAAVDTSSLTVEELRVRRSPGGTDSVNFSPSTAGAISAEELLGRASPGGTDKLVLGSDAGDWNTSSAAHCSKSSEITSWIQSVRPPPGGVDSVKMGAVPDLPSVEALLARPACGGASTVVLGGDSAQYATNSSAMGDGCSDAANKVGPHATAHTAAANADSIDFSPSCESTPVRKPMRTMVTAVGSATNVTLNDIAASPEPGVSSNRFASGNNQNAGNWITERPTTRLHQAPGGNSSISLGDASFSPEVGVSSNRFASGANPNAGNGITDRSSTTVRQAPGGVSSICLEHKVPETVQDENVNRSNTQPSTEDLAAHPIKAITQAPGGNSSLVLG
jgi:hypothetical protein